MKAHEESELDEKSAWSLDGQLYVLYYEYLSVVSLAIFVAFFGVDLWNPTKVGSHLTGEKSRD